MPAGVHTVPVADHMDRVEAPAAGARAATLATTVTAAGAVPVVAPAEAPAEAPADGSRGGIAIHEFITTIVTIIGITSIITRAVDPMAAMVPAADRMVPVAAR